MTTLLDQLAATAAGTDAATDERVARELEAVRARFKQAAEDLDGARFRSPDGKGREVEELPWYVFIGAPGSGKTTALLNSGLRFPLYTGADSRAFGARRGRHAQLRLVVHRRGGAARHRGPLHHAGKRPQGGRGRLARLPRLLKQFRPRRPLNGALVTVSVSDLLLWTKAERARYAAHVRMRLSEMYAALETALSGLRAGHQGGPAGGLHRVLRRPGPERARAGLGHAPSRCEIDPALVAEPYARGLRRAGGPPGRRDAGAAAGGARPAAARRDLPLPAAVPRHRPARRGVPRAGLRHAGEPQAAACCAASYFTSGTQEGNPIDRVLAPLARTFALERAAASGLGGTGKSYFLTRLLREVVFPEAGSPAVDAPAPRADAAA